MKPLKIGENTFLFSVVVDPLERANLKDRQPGVYRRLVSEYEEWNATMLPEDPSAGTHWFPGSALAVHYGSEMNLWEDRRFDNLDRFGLLIVSALIVSWGLGLDKTHWPPVTPTLACRTSGAGSCVLVGLISFSPASYRLRPAPCLLAAA